MKILLVDDEADIVAELGRFLRRRGHDVVGAGDVAAALAALTEAGPFDVVLTDLRMPDGSGMDVVRACRACAAPQPAALVMSGHAGRSDIAQLHDEGALHFFPKPVVLPALMKALEEVAAARPASVATTASRTPSA